MNGLVTAQELVGMLRSYQKRTGISNTEMAKKLRVSQQYLCMVLRGSAAPGKKMGFKKVVMFNPSNKRLQDLKETSQPV